MANLDLIKQLNNNYGKSSPISLSTEIVELNEAFEAGRIVKALSSAIADLGPLYAGYFDMGMPADVAMIFVDVCSFSTRFGGLHGKEVGEYFDEYYDIVVPIIYKNGGEVDKIIGDGIIAVFGPPFIKGDLNEHHRKADMCSRAIISATLNTKFSSKVALHSGTINYYKNKTGLYKEFTMIGKPLTELFRLEGISEDNCINYFDGSLVADYYESIKVADSAPVEEHNRAPWKRSSKPINNLKGVSYTKLSIIKFKSSIS